MATNTRTFDDKPAVRERVPLILGAMGPSGGGKTYSALRLATGIQRVSGGDIFVIDTEARRALHYADKFKFRHVVFGAPFGSLDYLAAIEHCVKKGAGVVVVDSMSHEHEGQGGLLEAHEAEVQRLSKGDSAKAERIKMLAWNKPKQARRRLINSILQMPCNFIFCFRAKEKLKIQPGKEPEFQGFMPIAGEEFVFEMMVNLLFLPSAGGIPTWQSNEKGEKRMIKLPEQFKQLFLGAKVPVSEDHGEQIAKWAAGDAGAQTVYEQLSQLIREASTLEILSYVQPKLHEARDKKTVPPSSYKALVEQIKVRKADIEAAATGESYDDEPPESEPSPESHDPETGEVRDEPSDEAAGPATADKAVSETEERQPGAEG
jgi:ABC-type dipeptide/oligopeptide/nickel transport system ATPase subunit